MYFCVRLYRNTHKMFEHVRNITRVTYYRAKLRSARPRGETNLSLGLRSAFPTKTKTDLTALGLTVILVTSG